MIIWTMVLVFYGNFFTDPTYYPVHHSARLIQYIIDNTPLEVVSQERDYLGEVLNRRIDIIPFGDEAVPEKVKQRFSHGRIIYDIAKEGNKVCYVPVHNGRLLALIDPAFHMYRPGDCWSAFCVSFLIISVLSVLIGFWMTLSMIRRLSALKAVAEKIYHGDVTARITTPSSGLIGNVEACFNQMAESIQSILTNRQNLLNTIMRQFETLMAQISGHLKKLAFENAVPKAKNRAQILDQDVDVLERVISDMLLQEKKRAQANRPAPSSLQAARTLDERRRVRIGVMKFMSRMFLCIFGAFLLTQLCGLGVSQIAYKYLWARPTWYPARTMATLIQRAIDRTPIEQFPNRLETLQADLKRRIDLVSAETAHLFTKTLQQEFPCQMAYGVFNGREVFYAPVHAGAYALMIDPAFHLYRNNPSLRLHIYVLVSMFVLVTLLGVFLSLPIIINLKKIKEGIEGIRQDNLNVRVDIPLNRPIGALARCFNEMAERIQLLLNHQKILIQAVAHEIRTPLARIRFHLEMLTDAGSISEIHRRSGDIEEEIKELILLVNELRTLTTLDTLSTDLEVTPIVLHDTLAEIAAYHEKTNQRLSITLLNPPNGGLSITAHPVYFKLAIQNILSNAVRYAGQKVILGYGPIKEGVFIDICDDGPGIPVQARKSVLEPFTRLDGSRSRKSGGFGLGLAIVKHILLLHGGSVSIADNFPTGAIITTYWPGQGHTG
ncbi:MAG: ATP-binding protein [Pseudomonadota bacterium]